MNSEHDLDHLIDAAARQMAQCEPSAAMSEAVMERIAARPALRALPRVMWGSVAAGAAIVAVVIAVGVNRTAAPPSAADSGLKAQGHAEAQSAEAGAEGPKTEGSGLKAQASGTEKALIASIAVEEMEPISDSIPVDVIAPAPLEVDRLVVTTLASIDPIEIAPLEIEPLSASND